MKFGWARKRGKTADHALSIAVPTKPALERVEHQRQHTEAFARRIEEEWNALSDEARADLKAAYVEQSDFMAKHGINNFRACRRAEWGDSSQSHLLDAAAVRAETRLLKTVFDEDDTRHASESQALA